jgi:CrcB protein
VTIFLVGAGGVVGVLARYALGTAVPTHGLPWLTVGINITGSFLLGFLIASGGRLSAEVRTGLAVGVLGGFTTFSTFSADVFLELEAGDVGEAVAFLGVSVVGGVAAAGAGYLLGRAVTT